MADLYAQDFTQILPTLQQNSTLRNAIIALIDAQPMPGKVTEGGDRLQKFRSILKDLVTGQITLPQAYQRTANDIPPRTSPHSSNNRVFPTDWEERLVRTQLSRFYNQAVMEDLLAKGETECHVPHSSAEDRGSACSLHLAGRNIDLKMLYDRLINAYTNGNWTKDVKIPNHPHCTHVVAPRI